MILVQRRQDGQHILGGRCIQLSCGLVSEDDRRIRDQRSRDSHPLLLSAGQLLGTVVQPVPQADDLQGTPRTVPAFLPAQAGQQQGQLDVLPSCQDGDQIERLEHVADVLGAPSRQFAFIHFPDCVAEHFERTLRGAVDPSHQVQQGRLTRT